MASAPSEDANALAAAKKVTLRSSDGEDFTVDEAVAAQSETLKHMIQDGCAGDAIPLTNIDGKTLALIINYASKHAEQPPASAADLAAWDVEFIGAADMDTLYDLLLGANYLNAKGLLDLCVQTVADMLNGKTVEEMREMFNIKNDFTPEQEAEIRKPYAWAFEY